MMRFSIPGLAKHQNLTYIELDMDITHTRTIFESLSPTRAYRGGCPKPLLQRAETDTAMCPIHTCYSLFRLCHIFHQDDPQDILRQYIPILYRSRSSYVSLDLTGCREETTETYHSHPSKELEKANLCLELLKSQRFLSAHEYM